MCDRYRQLAQHLRIGYPPDHTPKRTSEGTDRPRELFPEIVLPRPSGGKCDLLAAALRYRIHTSPHPPTSDLTHLTTPAADPRDLTADPSDGNAIANPNTNPSQESPDLRPPTPTTCPATQRPICDRLQPLSLASATNPSDRPSPSRRLGSGYLRVL